MDDSLAYERYLRHIQPPTSSSTDKPRGRLRRQRKMDEFDNIDKGETSSDNVPHPTVRNLVNHFDVLSMSDCDSNHTLDFVDHALRLNNFPLRWKSASDNNINFSLTKDKLDRLDSETEDFYLNKPNRLFRSWSRDSVSQGSTSPCSDNLLSRFASCDRLLGSFHHQWGRSSSSDSAVVVEDDCSSNTFDSMTTTSETLHSDSVVLRRPTLARRPPSVVISDHSGAFVSVHVALASEGFSLNNVVSNDYLLSDGYVCPRKVSECSTCSSVSTVDMSSRDDWRPSRRNSDCSSCYLTASDDEVEVSLHQPTPPPVRKNSNAVSIFAFVFKNFDSFGINKNEFGYVELGMKMDLKLINPESRPKSNIEMFPELKVSLILVSWPFEFVSIKVLGYSRIT